MQVFSDRVLAWFDKNGRKHLPWQQKVSAYKTWISEIMLQQTQVATVIPYFNRFITTFPDIATLANASQDQVLAHWAGLGYYSRARNLHKSAQIIRDTHAGKFPANFDEVLKLPGIGESTAGAILSLSYQQRHPILDGNVKRVLSRHQLIDGIPNQSKTLKKQWSIAENLTPHKHCDKYTQAMMDLGAMICTRSKPKCEQCPISTDCGAFQNNRINEYPNKKPKKKLPEKQSTILIITDNNRIYLEKRPENGIWGGLWSLPEIDHEKNIEKYLKKNNLIEISREQQSIYKHTFTHYHLYLMPIILTVSELIEGHLLSKRNQLGLPTPIQKILNNTFE